MSFSSWKNFPQTQKLIKSLEESKKSISEVLLTGDVSGQSTEEVGIKFMLLRERYMNLLQMTELIDEIDSDKKEIDGD